MGCGSSRVATPQPPAVQTAVLPIPQPLTMQQPQLEGAAMSEATTHRDTHTRGDTVSTRARPTLQHHLVEIESVLTRDGTRDVSWLDGCDASIEQASAATRYSRDISQRLRSSALSIDSRRSLLGNLRHDRPLQPQSLTDDSTPPGHELCRWQRITCEANECSHSNSRCESSNETCLARNDSMRAVSGSSSLRSVAVVSLHGH